MFSVVSLTCHAALGNTLDTVFGELEVHAFGRHQRFVLYGSRGVRLGQDTFEIFGRQRLQLNADRQTALQFRIRSDGLATRTPLKR